jgi:type IV pilus biogenesis protein PilP
MADKDQGSDTKSRRKILIIILVIAAGFIAWEVMGMFGSKSEVKTVKTAINTPPPPPMPTPKAVEILPSAPLTPREMALMQLQQETEAKYVAAVNELQMLKVQRDIAETNKAIASAKLDTVNSEKNIVTLLTPEQNANYSQRLANPAQAAAIGPQGPGPAVVEVAYTVISVSEIQGRWGAVLGVQGKLYTVRVGDVLPTDGSKVVFINRSGVVLQKDGMRKTVSLVPII